MTKGQKYEGAPWGAPSVLGLTLFWPRALSPCAARRGYCVARVAAWALSAVMSASLRTDITATLLDRA
jgi:hypothetical protein